MPEIADMMQLVGQEITLRFADNGITGRLERVETHPWGAVLHITSRIGTHYVPFPGAVMQVVIPLPE